MLQYQFVQVFQITGLVLLSSFSMNSFIGTPPFSTLSPFWLLRILLFQFQPVFYSSLDAIQHFHLFHHVSFCLFAPLSMWRILWILFLACWYFLDGIISQCKEISHNTPQCSTMFHNVSQCLLFSLSQADHGPVWFSWSLLWRALPFTIMEWRFLKNPVAVLKFTNQDAPPSARRIWDVLWARRSCGIWQARLFRESEDFHGFESCFFSSKNRNQRKAAS